MIDVILLVAAVVCAGLAAFGVRLARVHLGWLALTLFVLASLL